MPHGPCRGLGLRRTAAAALILLGACASTPSGTAPTLERAEAAYRRGEFETASRLAASVEATSTGLASEEAAYVRGLSEARLGRLEDAEQALDRAAGSSDPDLASRARRSLEAFDGPSDSGVARPSTSARGGFTVQAGAFSSEAAARDRAAELIPVARQAGFGPPTVEAISSRRGRLWAVQIGWFGDRRQAGAARSRLGHPQWAIEAVEGR